MSGDNIKGEVPNEPKTFDPGRTNDVPRLDDHEWTIGWFDASYGADKWFGLSHVPPHEAALLLCGFNPHDSDSTDSALTAAIQQSTSDTKPADLKAAVTVFEDAQSADPAQRRTLRDWLDMAKSRTLRHHRWVDEYIESDSRLRGDEPAESIQAAPSALVDAHLVPREELLAAFPQWLKREWFNNLSDRAWLRDARRVHGTPGRGGRPALFCPYAVMDGLMKHVKGKRLPQVSGWHILKTTFPASHALNESKRPRTKRNDDE